MGGCLWAFCLAGSILGAKMNQFLRHKNLRSIFQDILMDSYTHINANRRKVLIRIIETLTYRLAGQGIPVTKNTRKLINLKNYHSNSRAFIIGNGPSLNLCDLQPLENEITFGVNAIYLNSDKMGFHPTYYVVEDVFVAEDRSKEINDYEGSIKFFGNYLNHCIDNGPSTIWLNVRFNYRDYPDFPHFSTNASRTIWVGGTVSYICMQLAYYMGISRLYLIGFDHSYSIPDDALVNGTKITSESDDPNHFHPNYFGKGYRWHDPQLNRMEKAYEKAKFEYEKIGRVIFNATVGGYLEIFDRIEYSSLF